MKTNHDIKLGVSLYSYQDNYYFHKYDLEGCLAAAAGAGAEGIEIFPDAMIPEWPYISDAFVDKFTGMLERYGLKCVCVDHFSDTRMWKNKNLSNDDLYERGVMYIKAAAKLGAPAVRLLHEEHIGVFDKSSPMSRDYHLTNVEIVERLLPVAAEYNVMMALECHAPSTISDPCHEPYLEAAERLGLPFVGLQADFSSYEYCITSADVGMYTRQGANPEILNLIRNSQREAYFSGKIFDFEHIREKIERIGLNEVDKKLLKNDFIYGINESKSFENLYKTLKEYASRLVYIHGKFYDIDEDGQVDNMDYPKIFKALVDGGYKGYICSEFEGNRRMNDAGWVNEIEYVRKHQVLMRKCLGYE
ncbi:MAG TPA: TIM barrel protein [Clostridiales bacterium]|nr:TIM barrel protein [Clostridiales bacterium]